MTHDKLGEVFPAVAGTVSLARNNASGFCGGNPSDPRHQAETAGRMDNPN